MSTRKAQRTLMSCFSPGQGKDIETIVDDLLARHSPRGMQWLAMLLFDLLMSSPCRRSLPFASTTRFTSHYLGTNEPYVLTHSVKVKHNNFNGEWSVFWELILIRFTALFYLSLNKVSHSIVNQGIKRSLIEILYL